MPLLVSPLHQYPIRRCLSRWLHAERQVKAKRFSDSVRYPSEGRTVRVSLASPKLIGAAVSRGTRKDQQDAHAVAALQIPYQELEYSLKRDFGITWHPGLADSEIANQVVYVGLFDGHGGPVISNYLKDHLHGLFETVSEADAVAVVNWLKGRGGYFRRYTGGILEDWVKGDNTHRKLDLETRITLAFLKADHDVAQLPEAQRSGTTASVAILQSLDVPALPFWASEYQALTVAHCGDTRIILCGTESGKAFPMTEDHHAETRGEAARLRRLGTGLVTDSYGEARWMGHVANTRGLGDLEFKSLGVTPEPDIRRRLLKGRDWAFLALVSDGITSRVSDQEIVDLARGAKDSAEAAQRILAFAEELGSEDNASVLVVPLPGWGAVKGPDETKEIREYRRKQAEGSERQRRM